ncbi:MAG: tRNA pseudouridine(55) synthase TruB [Planctomycetaceae bacterium]|nr:tRNA pseudouridine(55) synthase TruB [Planctomycetaceae bacterium]
MFGLLNINKPAGKSSRDVVNHVQRLVRPAKVGHAGTLDPLATGVLVVCVGPATRLIQYVQQLPKRYLATFQLGCRSDSDDVELEVFPVEAGPPTRVAIEAAIPSFVGTIQQRPPAFSAIKVKGKRAYQLARDGEQVQLDTRPITVHSIETVSYDYPELVLDIRCGSGTYIRSIGRDLAEQLGTAAVMSALQRSEIGPFSVEQAAELQQLTNSSIEDLLHPASEAVVHLPSIQLNDEEFKRLSNGVMLDRPADSECNEVAAFDAAGRIVAMLAPHGENKLRPTVNFAPAMLAAQD